jgi:hypothetical protein
MFSVKFEWKEDEEFGGEGWIPTRFPNFNASSGLGVAHDTLEHFANDDESLAAEMRALGAMIYLRGEGGYFVNRNSRTPEANIGADIAHFLEELSNGDHSDYGDFPTPPRTCSLNDNANEMLEVGLKEGKKVFIIEMAFQDDSERYSNHDVDLWLDKMRGWMRIGYRKAVKRYHHNCPYETAYLFERIQKEVDARHKRADLGEILTVRVDPRNLDFKMSQDYPQYQDY